MKSTQFAPSFGSLIIKSNIVSAMCCFYYASASDRIYATYNASSRAMT